MQQNIDLIKEIDNLRKQVKDKQQEWRKLGGGTKKSESEQPASEQRPDAENAMKSQMNNERLEAMRQQVEQNKAMLRAIKQQYQKKATQFEELRD